MRRRIIYTSLPQRPGMIRRAPFTPLSQEPSQAVNIGRQIIGYFKTGQPITAPVAPIKTEIVIPPDTKKFIRTTVFTLAGAIVGSIVLYQALK